MVEPHKDLVVQGEWLVARTLPSILKGKVLVQLINLETSLIRLPNHTSITDLHVLKKAPLQCLLTVQKPCCKRAWGHADFLDSSENLVPSSGEGGVADTVVPQPSEEVPLWRAEPGCAGRQAGALALIGIWGPRGGLLTEHHGS
ncbi:hypothetical protein AB205_0130500 [Aquarana catesbeiana]|uniref:Uncharacterized protein n=1 Tax=Aquarana catesbeiana TaxID=8400 RepID=A0A2G9RDI7_AQUCT|nr:hypothetical protein AB205_0130500 [Aquarana catesbeiana]